MQYRCVMAGVYLGTLLSYIRGIEYARALV